MGWFGPTTEGTPQGGPLSPLLSNLMLDVLDKELEKRGHRFVRYADDCNIYVRSRRAGGRVMASVTRFLARRLTLKVNADKSAVDRQAMRAFLGFSFTAGWATKRRIAPQALGRFKARVGEMTRCTKSVSLTRLVTELSRYLVRWRGYFGFCEAPSVLRRLDQWVTRRLRAIVWRQWKRGRTRFAALRRLGVRKDLAAKTAGSAYGPWWISNSPALSYALPNAFFDRLGLAPVRCRPARLLRRTAVYGPVCTVVWEGWSREAPPYPDCFDFLSRRPVPDESAARLVHRTKVPMNRCTNALARMLLAAMLAVVCFPGHAEAQEERRPELSVETLIETARKALEEGNLEDAEFLLEGVKPGEGNVDDLDFLHGTIAAKRGDWETAIARFRAMLARDPELPRVRLDLALAYFQARQDGSAAYHFRQALGDESLPPVARARALAFLDAIRRRRSWSLNGGIALVPDDNINAATSARLVQLFGFPAQLSEDARQTSGVGVSAFVSGGYEARLSPDIRFRINTGLYTRTYEENQFNDRTLTLRAGPRFIFEDFDLRPELTGRFRELGGETYNRVRQGDGTGSGCARAGPSGFRTARTGSDRHRGLRGPCNPAGGGAQALP